MNFKPGDFFLGIVDFLGVLVPGALLVYLESGWIKLVFDVSVLESHWLVFAAAAYFVGHLLLAITELLNGVAQYVARIFPIFPVNEKESKVLMERCLPILGDAATGNRGTSFHAALSFLRIKNADAAAEIDRHMAGYKLLRCLVAVFLADLALSLTRSDVMNGRIVADLVLAGLFFYSFVRMLQWSQLLAFQYCILIDENH